MLPKLQIQDSCLLPLITICQSLVKTKTSCFVLKVSSTINIMAPKLTQRLEFRSFSHNVCFLVTQFIGFIKRLSLEWKV